MNIPMPSREEEADILTKDALGLMVQVSKLCHEQDGRIVMVALGTILGDLVRQAPDANLALDLLTDAMKVGAKR